MPIVKHVVRMKIEEYIYPNQLAKVHLWGVKLDSLLWKPHHSNVSIRAYTWSS